MQFQTNLFGNFSVPSKSQRIQTQFSAVQQRLGPIRNAASKHGVDPHLLAAVMSRETDVETSSSYRSLNQYGISPQEQLNRIRATLDRNVTAGQITASQRQAYLEMSVNNFPGLHPDERCWGDGGAQGYGPMQLDYRYNAHIILKVLAQPTRDQRLQAALEEGAAILIGNLRVAQRRYGSASSLRQMQAAIAAYNCGFGNIQDINNPDARTTGGDYSSDVIGRMLLLSKSGVLGGAVVQTSTNTQTSTTTTTSHTSTNTSSSTASGSTYTVVAGDTGGRIAQKLGVSFQTLATANPGLDWTRLKIGQTLRVPGASSTNVSTVSTNNQPYRPEPVAPNSDIRLLDTYRAQVEALLQQVTQIVRAYPLTQGQSIVLSGTQLNILNSFINNAYRLLSTYQGASSEQRRLFDAKYPGYLKSTQDQHNWLKSSYLPHVRTGSPQQVSTPTLQGTVGRYGQNLKSDAMLVQQLLNKHGIAVGVDGSIGPQSIAAIERFQREKLGISNPDGRIEPNGSDWYGLLRA